MRRPKQRLRNGGEDERGINKDHRAAVGADCARRAEAQGPYEPDPGKDRLASLPVGEGRRKRSDEGCRNHPRNRDQPHRGGSAVAEGNHAYRDRGRPLPRPDETEGLLRAPQVRTAQIHRTCREAVHASRTRPGEHPRSISPPARTASSLRSPLRRSAWCPHTSSAPLTSSRKKSLPIKLIDSSVPNRITASIDSRPCLAQ